MISKGRSLPAYNDKYVFSVQLNIEKLPNPYQLGTTYPLTKGSAARIIKTQNESNFRRQAARNTDNQQKPRGYTLSKYAVKLLNAKVCNKDKWITLFKRFKPKKNLAVLTITGKEFTSSLRNTSRKIITGGDETLIDRAKDGKATWEPSLYLRKRTSVSSRIGSKAMKLVRHHNLQCLDAFFCLIRMSTASIHTVHPR